MSPKHLHIEGLATLISVMIDSIKTENELGGHIGEKREMHEAGKLSGLF